VELRRDLVSRRDMKSGVEFESERLSTSKLRWFYGVAGQVVPGSLYINYPHHLCLQVSIRSATHQHDAHVLRLDCAAPKSR
jgi:hypothetical protein